jgi:ATP-dependent 26S proteasome regulatory subunit
MRSQLLICLEEFRGIVIFATNLVVNYDQAFLTRLISVKFIEPDVECRKKIWDVHIYPSESQREKKLNIPLDLGVNTQELAEKYNFCGREIRTAVISACVKTAMDSRNIVTQADFMVACDKIIKERDNLKEAKDNTVANFSGLKIEKTPISNLETKELLKDAFKEKIHAKQEQE